MHKQQKHILRHLLCWLIITTACVTVQAQKLPNVQRDGLRAPANIKIDGKATEWDNKFQAYNDHVEFFYTLSNDDKNLYLTVQAPERDVIRRITNGGITLTIYCSGKEDDKNTVKITYPLFENNKRFAPLFGRGINTENMTGQNKLTDEERAAMIMVGGKVGIPLTPKQADSLMQFNNTDFPAKAKNIGVTGIQDVDSLISVYNTDGIKVAAKFDIKVNYTYEMALPLKYLPLITGKTDKFMYRLSVNAVVPVITITPVNLPVSPAPTTRAALAKGPVAQPATDFGGEYRLVK